MANKKKQEPAPLELVKTKISTDEYRWEYGGEFSISLTIKDGEKELYFSHPFSLGGFAICSWENIDKFIDAMQDIILKIRYMED